MSSVSSQRIDGMNFSESHSSCIAKKLYYIDEDSYKLITEKSPYSWRRPSNLVKSPLKRWEIQEKWNNDHSFRIIILRRKQEMIANKTYLAFM